jgi:hypothetical protein
MPRDPKQSSDLRCTCDERPDLGPGECFEACTQAIADLDASVQQDDLRQALLTRPHGGSLH